MSDANMTTAERDQRGFALPAAIFALVVVALLVTSGFFISGQERSIGQSTEFASQATLLAETGMNEVLATWTPGGAGPEIGGAPVNACANCTGGVPSLNGQWQVAISRVGDKIYFIESTGAVNQAGRLSGATRTVGTLARLLTADFSADAALTTRGDVRAVGGAKISGMDVNPPGSVCTGPLEDKFGVITEPLDNVEARGSSVIEGKPDDYDLREFEPDDLRLGELSWAQLTHPDGPADIRFDEAFNSPTEPSVNAEGKCDKEDRFNWGNPRQDPNYMDCVGYYPMIYINGDATLNAGSQGQGVLLVNGDLRMNGGFLFQGIIMVTGRITVNGSGNRVFGAVIAANGLTIDPTIQQFTGTQTVQYSSCAISNVVNNLSGLTALRPVQNRSWVDLTAVGF